jgi:hypothetical protein
MSSASIFASQVICCRKRLALQRIGLKASAFQVEMKSPQARFRFSALPLELIGGTLPTE